MNTYDPVGVAVVDNSLAERIHLTQLLDDDDRFVVRGEFSGVSEQLYEVCRPGDVIVLDLLLGRDNEDSLPHVAPLAAAKFKVVIHTNVERPAPLRAALDAGARGIIIKYDWAEPNLDDLLYVARSEGKDDVLLPSPAADALIRDSKLYTRLRPRQIKVLQGIAAGLSHDQIAAQLFISTETVKTHVQASIRTLRADGHSVRDGRDAVRHLQRQGSLSWLS